ncbi:MAG: OmpA family protein [Nevskia sp.]|nr:OmpA family protein [Nevskia sp.]
MRKLAVLVSIIGLCTAAAASAQSDPTTPAVIEDAPAAAPESTDSSTPSTDSSTASTDTTTTSSDAASSASNWGLPGERDIDYISILGSYLFTDTKRAGDANSGAGASLIFGRHFANHFGWEANYSMDVIETGSTGGGDYYRHTLGGDLTYSFGDRQHFTPFLLIGGGGDFTDAHPRSLNGPSGYVDGGVGIVSSTFWHNRVRLRAEGRAIHDFLSVGGHSGFTDYRASLGIEIPFYEPKAYDVPTPQPPTEVVKVIETKTGLEDSDGDGVVDTSDKCPDTPPNTRVDGDGCTIPKILRLDGVTFEFDKSHLRPDSETILSYVVKIMKKYPDMQVELAGYTDSKGSAAYNLKLSQRRAAAVKEYLVAHGIEAARIAAKGYGKENPVASNDTDEGRERNRRVELHILN